MTFLDFQKAKDSARIKTCHDGWSKQEEKKVLVRNHVKFSEEKKTIFDILGFKTNPGLLFKLKIPFSCIHIFFEYSYLFVGIWRLMKMLELYFKHFWNTKLFISSGLINMLFVLGFFQLISDTFENVHCVMLQNTDRKLI